MEAEAMSEPEGRERVAKKREEDGEGGVGEYQVGEVDGVGSDRLQVRSPCGGGDLESGGFNPKSEL